MIPISKYVLNNLLEIKHYNLDKIDVTFKNVNIIIYLYMWEYCSDVNSKEGRERKIYTLIHVQYECKLCPERLDAMLYQQFSLFLRFMVLDCPNTFIAWCGILI